MAQRKNDRTAIARKAGATKSPAKAAASRRNLQLAHQARRRQGNPEIRRIMAERGVTRQRAHQILKAAGG